MLYHVKYFISGQWELSNLSSDFQGMSISKNDTMVGGMSTNTITQLTDFFLIKRELKLWGVKNK